jgi:2-oxoglutarate dehydrogenase E2 component (dihydrolipoamide succinyltransferase)
VGESVVKDEPLIELETDKVTVEIASPATGRLVEIVTQSDQEVTPGDVLGRISAEGADDSVERTEVLVTPPMADSRGETHYHPRGATPPVAESFGSPLVGSARIGTRHH